MLVYWSVLNMESPKVWLLHGVCIAFDLHQTPKSIQGHVKTSWVILQHNLEWSNLQIPTPPTQPSSTQVFQSYLLRFGVWKVYFGGPVIPNLTRGVWKARAHHPRHKRSPPRKNQIAQQKYWGPQQKIPPVSRSQVSLINIKRGGRQMEKKQPGECAIWMYQEFRINGEITHWLTFDPNFLSGTSK